MELPFFDLADHPIVIIGKIMLYPFKSFPFKLGPINVDLHSPSKISRSGLAFIFPVLFVGYFFSFYHQKRLLNRLFFISEKSALPYDDSLSRSVSHLIRLRFVLIIRLMQKCPDLSGHSCVIQVYCNESYAFENYALYSQAIYTSIPSPSVSKQGMTPAFVCLRPFVRIKSPSV